MEFGLSLGSNLGERLANLVDARTRVAALPEVARMESSRVYETEPVDVADIYRDFPFLNAVLIVQTATDVESFSFALHRIETDMGRVREADKNAPRKIDIDILYADDCVREAENLKLPHPRWETRRFVVQPLAELRPELVLPGQTQCTAALLAALPSTPNVIPFATQWEALP